MTQPPEPFTPVAVPIGLAPFDLISLFPFPARTGTTQVGEVNLSWLRGYLAA
jgi:hypothetical protein